MNNVTSSQLLRKQKKTFLILPLKQHNPNQKRPYDEIKTNLTI